MYDRSCDFWNLVCKIMMAFSKKEGRMMKESRMMARRWTTLWGAHQRFYRQMLMAAKVRALPPRLHLATPAPPCRPGGGAQQPAQRCPCTPALCGRRAGAPCTQSSPPQVPACTRLARQAVRDGHAVVIGLQSTGESNTTAQRDSGGDEMDDFVRGGGAWRGDAALALAQALPDPGVLLAAGPAPACWREWPAAAANSGPAQALPASSAPHRRRNS
jgi:hypothetical protein